MVDPASSEGKEMLEYLKLFLEHHVPTRLGLLLLPSNELGHTLTRGFSDVVRDKSPRDAFKWLIKVRMTRGLTLVSL